MLVKNGSSHAKKDLGRAFCVFNLWGAYASAVRGSGAEPARDCLSICNAVCAQTAGSCAADTGTPPDPGTPNNPGTGQMNG